MANCRTLPPRQACNLNFNTSALKFGSFAPNFGGLDSSLQLVVLRVRTSFVTVVDCHQIRVVDLICEGFQFRQKSIPNRLDHIMTPLQPLKQEMERKVGSEAVSHTEPTATEPREDDSKGVKVETASRLKRISIAVTTLLGYSFLNIGISMISPFYPVVVSCNIG